MAKYRLIQLDVWGNAKDGWVLNDRMPLDVYFDIDVDSWKEIGFRKLTKNILTAIYNAGILLTNDGRKLTVDYGWDGSYLEVQHKKEAYKPLFGLELMEDEA